MDADAVNGCVRKETVATTIEQNRITWAPSVTGGIAPFATYQTATINPS
jgi:hypothetical protein